MIINSSLLMAICLAVPPPLMLSRANCLLAEGISGINLLI